ncbi:transporter substrate-binding domain-containing protein [Cohaesibacter marisflavi]|uniref:transporter substrate-binding domain-containing protein n=1 Tax=Cohaesibacter marisflavi TaxID=655353 RepID=UPI0029C7EB52|nr:transporter substrate-binding domain-containing protein [Cohaesibacter marisflavi]
MQTGGVATQDRLSQGGGLSWTFFLAVLSAFCLFLLAVTDGLAQTLTEEGQSEVVVEQPTNVEATRSPRSGEGDEPVTSEDWAKADFYGFIDIHQRLRQPSETVMDNGLRLLTAPDFPPFNYRNKAGAPVGYHVELARAFCEQLNIACTMKVVPFDAIPELLASDEADAALAGLVRHPELQGRVTFSNVFLKRPGRFLLLKDDGVSTDKDALQGKPVAVIGGSAHEAFLRAYFDGVNRVPVNDLHAARELLEEGKVVAIFGDAFQLLPIATQRNGIFSFAGEPYYDDHFFGDGMAFAYKAGRTDIGNLLNFGLQKLAQSGRLAELYARHFAFDVYASY